MNKADYKKFQQEVERKAQLVKALSSSRHVDDDIGSGDLGIRLLQIVYRPSFETTKVWEVRKHDNAYTVYEARMGKTDWYTIAPGYKPLAVDSDKLKQLLDRYNDLSISMAIPTTEMYGLDGDIYEVALFCRQSSVRVVWHDEPHDGWADLAALTRQAVEMLKMPGNGT